MSFFSVLALTLPLTPCPVPDMSIKWGSLGGEPLGPGRIFFYCRLSYRLPTKEWGSPWHSEMKICFCFQAKQLCSRFRPATARWSCGGHRSPGESVPGGNLGAHAWPRVPDWWVCLLPYSTGKNQAAPNSFIKSKLLTSLVSIFISSPVISLIHNKSAILKHSSRIICQ